MADEGAERRPAERQRRLKPVYDELLRWCRTYAPSEPPSSLLGKALQYLINHRVARTRLLDDGRLPIARGVVERLHRRPAVGRRNYLFAGAHAGGERGAVAYSGQASCALCEIDPVDYLADVVPWLSRGVFTRPELEALTPAAWKAARPGPGPPAPE